jgi:hypothetical protein
VAPHIYKQGSDATLTKGACERNPRVAIGLVHMQKHDCRLVDEMFLGVRFAILLIVIAGMEVPTVNGDSICSLKLD